jgi:hypothetical protein
MMGISVFSNDPVILAICGKRCSVFSNDPVILAIGGRRYSVLSNDPAEPGTLGKWYSSFADKDSVDCRSGSCVIGNMHLVAERVEGVNMEREESLLEALCLIGAITSSGGQMKGLVE